MGSHVLPQCTLLHGCVLSRGGQWRARAGVRLPFVQYVASLAVVQAIQEQARAQLEVRGPVLRNQYTAVESCYGCVARTCSTSTSVGEGGNHCRGAIAPDAAPLTVMSDTAATMVEVQEARLLRGCAELPGSCKEAC